MASILETFYILFKSNSDDLKKGQDEAKRSSQDLQDKLDDTTEHGNALATSLIDKFKEVGIAVAAAFGAERVGEFILKTAEANAQLGLTAERLGIAVEDIYAWGQAVEVTGGNVNDFIGTLDGLNRGVADIATKGTSRLKPFFDELKVRVTDGPKQVRPLVDILGDLADKLSGKSAQERAGIAERLQIDQGTLLMLAQGRRAVEDLVREQKELGTVTKEDTEIAHRYARSVEEVEDRFRLLATRIGSSFLPIVTQVFDWFGRAIDFLNKHRAIVEGFFIGVGAVIGIAFLPEILAATAGVLAFVFTTLAIPLAIAAVGVAFGLLYDDIQNFLAGNNSVIGELSKKWPELGETIKHMAKQSSEAWDTFVDGLVASKDLITSILNLTQTAFNNHADTVQKRQQALYEQNRKNWPEMSKNVDAFNDAMDRLGKKVESMLGGVVGWFLETFGMIPKALHKYAQEIDAQNIAMGGKPTFIHAIGDRGAVALKPNFLTPKAPQAVMPTFEVEGLKSARKMIAGADTSPLNSAAISSQQTQKTQNINVGPITVNVDAHGSDAKEISSHVEHHLKTALRQAVDQHDDGVQN